MKTKGIYFLYRVFLALGLPLLPLYFLFRSIRDSAYAGSVRQRLGFLPRSFRQTVTGAIWLHAVSVGETAALAELVRRLRAEYPLTPLFVSTATLAGMTAATRAMHDTAAGIFFAPVDYAFAIRHVLRTIRPSVLVVAETEIWPNLFREAKRSGCGLLIVNGRISDTAVRRYRAWRWFFQSVLELPDRVLAQNEGMRERYIRAGAPPLRVETGGNLKYDFTPRHSDLFEGRPRPGRIWIAASTMADGVDEDDAVIAGFLQIRTRYPDLLLILAPRKPERFDTAAQKLERAGIRFARRSSWNGDSAECLLLDTIGELAGLFWMADAVFMGGTLAARGGHNILEPAFSARPIVIGPHMENFRDIAEEFLAAGACVRIGSPAELAPAIERILQEPDSAREMGRRALARAESKRGATTRCFDEIGRLYAECFPCFRRSWLVFAALWPFSRLWIHGGKLKRSRALRRRKRLATPVISVGNITMGGTGKTPFVIWLAGQMRRAGQRPAILTRGYGRHEIDSTVILEPGESARVEMTGDESQICLRSGVAPLGIGTDRYWSGKMIEERGGADVFILDDGFQHDRLERQLDIVLIDALSPFGGCEVFPLGRLREPARALARAQLFVITRCEAARSVPAIERKLRKHNAAAPIFHARVVPEYWVEHSTGRQFGPRELPFARFAAFCGLGNPESFWATLRELGMQTATCEAFDDHHVYKPWEVRVLREHSKGVQAEAVVTTEKDAINLCEGSDDLLAPLPLYWLKIRMQVAEEKEFLEAVQTVSFTGRK